VTAIPLTYIDPLRPLLNRRPLGLFSDIDGTLSPIVERPEDAIVTPRCRTLLKRLIREGVRVALITGRTVEMARSMVEIDEAAYAANHGLEFWIGGQVESPEGLEESPALVERIVAQTQPLDAVGVHVERKGPAVAFHYRRALDRDAARAAILRAIDSSEAAQRFAVSEGRMVIELRPDVPENKGTAALVLARRLGVEGIVCLGDDRMDIDMFEAVRSLRDQGVEGVAVAVVSAESVPELSAAADYTVDGVKGVEWLLAELLRALAEK
jgi:trehalose 6-phosphate phosphatase